MFSLEFLPCISTHSKRYLRVEDIGKNLINWIHFPTKEVIVVNLKQFNSIPRIIYRAPFWVQIPTFATWLEGKEPIVPTLGTFWPSTVISYIPIKLQYLIWKFKSSFKKWLKGRKKKKQRENETYAKSALESESHREAIEGLKITFSEDILFS